MLLNTFVTTHDVERPDSSSSFWEYPPMLESCELPPETWNCLKCLQADMQ